MTSEEREFLNDIKDAVSDYGYECNHYHEDGYFCVDITINLDEWEPDEIWDALEEVTDDWGAGLDSDMKTYYLALEQ